MTLRRTLLRVMLASLVVAALCGVATVLFARSETGWRVVWTLVVTAVAAGLMMWMSALSERERTRTAGFFGLGWLLAEWLGAVALIWELPRAVGEYRAEDHVALTMLFGAGTAIWTMLALGFRARKGFALACRFGVMLAAAVTILWGLAVWWPEETTFYRISKLGESAWALTAMGIIASFSLLDFAWRRWWVWVSVAFGAAALALWLMGIWMEIHESNGTVECLATVAIVGAFCNVMRLTPVPESQRWLQWATMASAILTGLAVDTTIVLDKQRSDTELPRRLSEAAAILTGCGALGILVLSRMNRTDIRPDELPKVTEMEGVCPICQKRQKLAMGESRCQGCGLVFEIRVREPRCPQCNYILLMLKSDRCPECGAAV